MVRKWEAIYHLRKLRGFSLVALLVVMPSLSFANTVVTSQTYVDIQDALDEKLSNKLNGTSTSGQKIGDLAAGSAAGQDQVMYPSAAAVKEYSVAKNQGVGTNNANVGKTLVVNSSGVLELGSIDALPSGASNQVLQHNGSAWVSTTMDTTPTASSNKPVTSGGVATALNGKLDKNTAITGATKTKITYDSNGLVTAGADLVASDIPDLSSTYEVISHKVQTIDTTLQSGKDTNYPSQAAVESYVTAQASSVITQSITNSDTTHAPSGDAVYDALNNKQTKPSSGVASGKVLTYTGTDANANVSAAYVSIPVSSGAPSTNTPTSFAEVWVQ